MKILVTGATGNVGREIVAQLASASHDVTIGTRDGMRPDGSVVDVLKVDFEAQPLPAPVFDAIFIVRPPQLTDPDLFTRFLEPHDRNTRIVFLSVQGADTAAYLPHAKIEKAITAMGFAHVYVRPSYFMDNLTTTLWPELKTRRRIYLPAGKLALDWVSVRDVAAVCVAALTGGVTAPSVVVCSGQKTGFHAVADAITRVSGARVTYQPASLIGYCSHARKSGTAWSFILVMLLLHYLPRFSRAPVYDCAPTAAALGRPTETLDAFLHRHKSQFATLADQ